MCVYFDVRYNLCFVLTVSCCIDLNYELHICILLIV